MSDRYDDTGARKIRASPELLHKWTTAQGALRAELAKLRDPKLLPVLQALEKQSEILSALFQIQDEFNRSVFAAGSGYPAAHAPSHKGGADSIAGKTAHVEEIDFNQSPARGTPGRGYAPIDHVHGLSAELEGLEGIAGTTTEERDGAELTHVRDPELVRLLTAILLLLSDRED